MKQKIKVGGREVELDVLVKEELRTTLEETISGYLRPTSPRRDEDGLISGASGDVTITLPPVPRGMEVVYTRVVIEAPGSAFTAAAPYNAAGAYLNLLRDQELLEPLSLVAGAANGGGIPWRWTWSTSYGIRFRDGEALSVFIHVPPASTPLVLRADGFLSPLSGKEGSLLLPGS
jgi:hypothetical protein